MRGTEGLAPIEILQRSRARGAGLCRRHDRGPGSAGRGVRCGAQALQRTRDRRTDGAGRHLPDAPSRVHGAPGRRRAEEVLTRTKSQREPLSIRVPASPVIVVEDDPFTRLIPLVLDPNASEERRTAFADFMSTDEPDFAGWCARVRKGSAALYPAHVRLLTSEEEMRATLHPCVALVVESFRVTRDDFAAAPKLKVLQKFGTGLRTIHPPAC